MQLRAFGHSSSDQVYCEELDGWLVKIQLYFYKNKEIGILGLPDLTVKSFFFTGQIKFVKYPLPLFYRAPCRLAVAEDVSVNRCGSCFSK
jgi:hypothetical protein